MSTSLNHVQKKYIQQNVRKMNIDYIAKETKLSRDTVLAYLKSIWREEKYIKFIQNIEENNSCTSSYKQNTLIQWAKNEQNWGSILLLAILVMLVYANSLHNVFLSDDFGILQNKNTGTLKDVITQPLTSIRPFFYMIAYKLGGFNPPYFRMINILLHFGAVSALYGLLTIITRQRIALFAASLFAVHPIFVESVSWISGGGYAQYGFFFFLSLLYYILSKNSKKNYFLSIIFYLCSLLSSIAGATLGVMYFLYEILFGDIRKNWVKTVPFFILTIIFVYFALSGVGVRLEAQKSFFYQEAHVYNPLTQVPVALSSYLHLLFWPDRLTLYHSELTFSLIEFIIRVIVVISLLLSIVYSFFKNKFVFFWLSLFVVSLIPTLSPLGVSWIVAERYVYVGAIGIIVVFSYLLYKLSERPRFNNVVNIILIILIIALGVRTILRNIDWKNEDNLWVATAKTSPSDPKTHNNMGDVYFRHKDYEKAAMEFSTAIKLKSNYADAYHNLGNTFYHMQKYNEAVASYQKALSINPNIWQSYQNIAIIYFNHNNFEKAREYMEQAVKLQPANAQLLLNLSVIYNNLGNKQKAKDIIMKALELDPANTFGKKLLEQLGK